MSVEPHPVRVHVDPELPPLPPHAGVTAAEPFEAEVWVRAAPLGSWPHRVAAVAVAEDPHGSAADLTIPPAQYATGGIEAVMRAHRQRIACRPRLEDGLEAWLEAVRAVIGADGVAFHGATGVAVAGRMPPGTPEAPVASPAPQIVVHAGPPPTAALVVQTSRPQGVGVLVAARHDAGRVWAEATLSELAACAAAMTAATQGERAAALESRLDLVRAMLGVTVHDVRGALFGLELGTRLLARVPEADPVRTNLQGSVGTPLLQVRQTLSSVRTLLDQAPAHDGWRSSWSLEELWASTVAELTKDRPAPVLAVEQPLDPVRVSIPREPVQRVLSALVDNALSYGPPEAPVRVRWAPAGGVRRLEIRNRGRLPFADLSAIEPFAHRAPRHVGLWLWLARSEAARHGIALRVVQDGDEVVAVAEIPAPEHPPEA